MFLKSLSPIIPNSQSVAQIIVADLKLLVKIPNSPNQDPSFNLATTQCKNFFGLDF